MVIGGGRGVIGQLCLCRYSRETPGSHRSCIRVFLPSLPATTSQYRNRRGDKKDRRNLRAYAKTASCWLFLGQDLETQQATPEMKDLVSQMHFGSRLHFCGMAFATHLVCCCWHVLAFHNHIEVLGAGYGVGG